MFTEFWKQKYGEVAFGDNGRGSIPNIGKIGSNSTNSIDKVYLIDGLKYNFLSVSQLCDNDNRVWMGNLHSVTLKF